MPLLFTYGTLQNNNIQRQLFGKEIHGTKDFLRCYKLETIKIPKNHPLAETYFIARYTGNQNDKIDGTVYKLDNNELVITDKYEGSSYQRKTILLNSNKEAIIYCKPLND